MAFKRIDLTDCVGFELPWTAEDSAVLRHFLGTVTGRRFVGQLLLKRPMATEKSDATKRLIQSGIVEGAEDTIFQIGRLADSSKSVKVPTPPPSQTRAP